jgi:rhodanese-related sulfurtransferase
MPHGRPEKEENTMFRRRTAVQEMTPAEVEAVREDVQLVDVREPAEWQAGRIEGALHVPLASLPARLGEIDRDRPVVLVCRTGNRSYQATRFLAEQGYDARNLAGGVHTWLREGRALQTPGGQPGRVA